MLETEAEQIKYISQGNTISKWQIWSFEPRYVWIQSLYSQLLL